MAKGGGGGPALAAAANKPDYERYTSQGVAFSQIDKEKKTQLEKEKYTINTINDFVNGLTFPNGLANQEIFFMMGNYFCRKVDCYYPAELGIAKFSFEQGVIKKYHLFVNPGKPSMPFV